MYFEGIRQRMQVVRHLVVVVILFAQLHKELIRAYQLALHVVIHREQRQW